MYERANKKDRHCIFLLFTVGTLERILLRESVANIRSADQTLWLFKQICIAKRIPYFIPLNERDK